MLVVDLVILAGNQSHPDMNMEATQNDQVCNTPGAGKGVLCAVTVWVVTVEAMIGTSSRLRA